MSSLMNWRTLSTANLFGSCLFILAIVRIGVHVGVVALVARLIVAFAVELVGHEVRDDLGDVLRRDRNARHFLLDDFRDHGIVALDVGQFRDARVDCRFDGVAFHAPDYRLGFDRLNKKG